MHRQHFITMGLLLMAVALTLAPSRSLAQSCTEWVPGPLPGPLPGADGPVYAALGWSLPGQPTQLYVAGDFRRIGGIAANYIAMWDGYRWHALDAGRSGPVYALTTYNASLIAAGEGPIGAWNGNTWVSMGSPASTVVPGETPRVYALEVFDGELYAGGNFLSINPNPGFPGQGDLWRFNGSAWFNVPAGVGTAVRALQVFDPVGPASPALYIGGEGATSACLRTWNGSIATDVIGPYMDNQGNAGKVLALTVVNQAQVSFWPTGLVVGGDFPLVQTASGIVQANDVAHFDGTVWRAMGNGITNHANEYVSALTVYGSSMYAGGKFELIAGQSYRNIAQCTTSVWSILNFGEGAIHELQEVNGVLIAGGMFTHITSNYEGFMLARWGNGGTSPSWSNFSEPLLISALARIGSRIVMGGLFTRGTESGTPPVATNRYFLSTWDYVNEGGLGWGTNGMVLSLLGFSTGSGASAANHIVAGGNFTTCGPDNFGAAITANHVAIWTEDGFTPPGWNAMGNGFNADVFALERFNGWTVAGGAFNASGGTTVNRLSKYVGSPPSWQPLTSPDPGINGSVRALKAFSDSFGGTDTYLVIGGDFTAAPPTGVAANRILMRRESPIAGQSAYQALGAGFDNGAVYAIERYGSGFNARTYAGGSFTSSGGYGCNRVARLNNNNWEPFGTGGGFNGTVLVLKTIGGYLYAGGTFTTVDGIPAKGLAKWNGTAWSDASGGTDRTVYALLSHQSELIAGGDFSFVQSGLVGSPGVARLKLTGVPWVTKHPTSLSIPCHNYATFSVSTPINYGGLSYTWRRNGTPLADGPTPHGSIIYTSNTATLQIDQARTEDAGSYDCVIANSCGSVTSNAATLTVGSCCVGDIAPQPSGDGTVGVPDLLTVINGWGACPGNCPPTCSADVNLDCTVGVPDLLSVINHWGPCP